MTTFALIVAIIGIIIGALGIIGGLITLWIIVLPYEPPRHSTPEHVGCINCTNPASCAHYRRCAIRQREDEIRARFESECG